MLLKSIFYLNHLGYRDTQEDNIFPDPGTAMNDDRLFIVCDGVGGNSHGQVASRIVCEGIAKFISQLAVLQIDDKQIVSGISYAKELLQQYAVELPEAKSMSTTLTLTYLLDDGIWAVWCGDSRIYHIRDGAVLWQSKDHSLVQQLIDDGEITKEEAKAHPQRNIIMHSLSAAVNRSLYVSKHFIENIEVDDYILLCSDGILENVGESELMEILCEKQKVTDKQLLFLEYCENRTYDNFSMYLIQIGDFTVNTITK